MTSCGHPWCAPNPRAATCKRGRLDLCDEHGARWDRRNATRPIPDAQPDLGALT